MTKTTHRHLETLATASVWVALSRVSRWKSRDK